MNNETFRDKSVPVQSTFSSAAPDGVLTRAGRRPPTAQQREALVLALLTDPHFGRACTAAGISRAAGYRLVNSDPEVAEAMQLAKDLYLRDLLDAVREEAVEGHAPDEQPKRIRDNRLLAAALRTLMAGPAVTINNTNAQQNNASTGASALNPQQAIAELLRRARERAAGEPGRVIEGEASAPTPVAAPPVELPVRPDADGVEDLL